MAHALISAMIAVGALVGLASTAGAVEAPPRGRTVAMADCENLGITFDPDRASYQSEPVAFNSSKASAILGGASSALERILAQQNGQPARIPLESRSLPTDVRFKDLVASAGGLLPGSGRDDDCNRLAAPRLTLAPARAPESAASPATSDFLQTRRLSISHTTFDRQWRRVSRETISRGSVLAHPELRGVGLDLLQRVNAWANRRIRYAEDVKLYGMADYWATARSTIAQGAGDCEDIAIVKLQLLAAMGIKRSDLYLTIARDLARRADHAVLVVRMDERFWVLDNTADQLLDASSSYDYQPVLSFSNAGKWLHGAVTMALR